MDKLLDAEALARIARMLASDVDPTAYAVSSSRLIALIQEGPGSERLKLALINHLARTVIQGKATASCVEIGYVFAEFQKKNPDPELNAIFQNINDLDKLPYVTADGKPVS